MIENLLDTTLQLMDLNGEIVLNALETLIGFLIGAVGVTGIGIILYCLILKVAVLPLDVWQKASMRKNSLKMGKMRAQLEKLQKQYEDKPELYQKKMQDVYKENGYNMFSSCLPMIATLVILILAFNSLNGYSQSMNLKIYTDMAKAYDAAIMQYVGDDAAVTIDFDENGNPMFNTKNDANSIVYRSAYLSGVKLSGKTGALVEKTEKADGYTARYYKYNYDTKENTVVYFDEEEVTEEFIESDKLPDSGVVYFKESNKGTYNVNTAKLVASKPELKGDDAATTEKNCLAYVQKTGRSAAAESFRNANRSFGLTKNIFYPDVAWVHPLQGYAEFTRSINRDINLTKTVRENGEDKVIVTDKVVKVNALINESAYNELTAELGEEKEQPNGFFILVILTILCNLGSQFITMRAQKDQQELQTADKSQQSMNKMMMFMMPAMFCVFAFIYSAAFSLYLITSSIFSMISTLVINYFIDKKFKAEEAAVKAANGRKVYTRNWNNNK